MVATTRPMARETRAPGRLTRALLGVVAAGMLVGAAAVRQTTVVAQQSTPDAVRVTAVDHGPQAHMAAMHPPHRRRQVKVHPNGTARTRIDASCDAPCFSDAFPQWSPNGRRIVFQRLLGAQTGMIDVSAIFVMDANGSDIEQITQRGADPDVRQPYRDGTPTWSPDGRRLAFTRLRLSDEHTALFTVRLDGSDERRITPWRIDAGQMDWSPDGRWIAFIYGTETRRQIALVRPSGRRRHDITSTSGTWGSLSFSPDGSMIVSSHRETDEEYPDVYTLRINGSHVVDVTNTEAEYESAADWGPGRS
jgi:Tol biopolymer transport system component